MPIVDAQILIVDDEPAARYGMRKALKSVSAQVQEAEDGLAALELINASQPDVVLCDINMPKMNGLELLKTLESLESLTPKVIVITAFGSEKIAVEAMKAGAYDYLSKPYDIDELRLTVRKALEHANLQRENEQLRQQIASARTSDIIGDSEVMQQVHRLIDKVAPTDVTVLITGKSGTGKELVACTIHAKSSRNTGPFVTMNCAAIPKDLVESELFGHEKGAFTGASTQRQGKFELAHGGTLFLDEIADMSLDTQAKILRVLEDKSVTRLGGKEVLHADVRLISATNKNLEEEIQQGTFRQDLYFRLKVIEIKLPDLSERREDIPLLAQHYLAVFAERHQKPIKHISREALRLLVHYDWPGNIRELIHVLEQAVVLSEQGLLTPEDLPIELDTGSSESPEPFELGEQSFTEMKEQMVYRFERKLIEHALEKSQGNVSQAARLLKMKRQFLQAKMKSLGIDAEAFRR